MYELLSSIKGPEELKALDVAQLKALAKEIRSKIVETVAKNGGHLAPSLGVVELTLAIHYVFDAPKDRIIWDVGHQAYAHKLVTGRFSRFDTLRQYGGIAGFPKRKESPYDCLDTGHSSTSLSAGLGMTTAMDLEGREGRVVAVIGDGSMTAGMAFEALNHAGHIKKDLIVILNDNEMSISPNVGALSSFLSRKLTGRFARRFKREVESFLKRSDVGVNIWTVLKKSEESLKSLITPGMLFEAFQFDYVGPVPGHHLETLIETLENLKNLDGPVLLHCLTRKGKGYPPAEKEPERFHGVGPFDPETGAPLKPSQPAPPSYTKVFSQALIRIAKEDPRVVAITAAMPTGTGLDAFAKEFPHRFFDVGIAEQHAVTFAAGLALEGLRPVVAIYSTFLQRAYDQIIHDVCLSNLPICFAIDRGGLVGEDGPTHHGAFDLSFLRAVPNITVMAPKDENELQHMLFTALNHPGPCAIRYPRGRGVGRSLDWALEPIPIGKGELLRDGDDVALLAVGNHVSTALQAAEALAEQGIEARVINGRFIKPLDGELISTAARECKALVTIEENALMGGFGSAVLEHLADQGLFGARVVRLGLPDRFIEHGSQAILREKVGLTAEAVVGKVKELLEGAP